MFSSVSAFASIRQLLAATIGRPNSRLDETACSCFSKRATPGIIQRTMMKSLGCSAAIIRERVAAVIRRDRMLHPKILNGENDGFSAQPRRLHRNPRMSDLTPHLLRWTLSLAASRLKASLTTGRARSPSATRTMAFNAANASPSLVRNSRTAARGPISSAQGAAAGEKEALARLGRPRCLNCCWSLGVRYRWAYGFGRSERLRERDGHVDRVQARRLRGRKRRLTMTMRCSMIVCRLAQLAHQQKAKDGSDEPLPFMRAYQPRKGAIETIPDLKRLWKAQTTEALEQALDRRANSYPRRSLLRRHSNTINRRKPHVENAVSPTTWLDLRHP